jgi:hypothetical protein
MFRVLTQSIPISYRLSCRGEYCSARVEDCALAVGIGSGCGGRGVTVLAGLEFGLWTRRKHVCADGLSAELLRVCLKRVSAASHQSMCVRGMAGRLVVK